MISHRLTYLLLAIGCLLLTACSDRDDTADQLSDREVYISLAVTFTEGPKATMRADWWPRGGEHGNYNEAAFARENTVTGITLILYRTTDGKGLNSAENPTLELVRYFPITETSVTRGPQGDGGNWECFYFTGREAIGSNILDLKAKYHAIAFANLYPDGLTEGVSKLNDLKDKVFSGDLYMGNATRLAKDCTHFAMSSESNANTIDFSLVDPQLINGGHDLFYDLTGQGVEVERMVARLDFWAANSEGYAETNASGNAYYAPGYVYKVYDESGDVVTNDRFVVTHITPFNVNNGTEYAFKHVMVKNGEVGEPTDPWLEILAPEDGFYRAVVDPASGSKPSGSFLNPLSGITDASLENNASVPYQYRQSVAAMHPYVSANHGADGKSGGFMNSESYEDTGGTKYTIPEAEDVIIAYVKENALALSENVYNYATGLIIEGDYYTNDDVSTRAHRVYYGYIHHASRTNSPDAYKAYRHADLDNTLTNNYPTDPTSPMFYGVVRNNIYRVHIGKVFQRGTLSYSIRVKRWDKFTHEVIYM